MATLISFGAAIVVWLYWMIDGRESFLPHVVVTAIPESAGVSKVTVTAEKQGKREEKPEYTEPVEEWIQRELVEKRRAAVEAPQERPTATDDIPERIKRLAELRDSGAITEEDFERKKAELLDRL